MKFSNSRARVDRRSFLTSSAAIAGISVAGPLTSLLFAALQRWPHALHLNVIVSPVSISMIATG